MLKWYIPKKSLYAKNHQFLKPLDVMTPEEQKDFYMDLKLVDWKILLKKAADLYMDEKRKLDISYHEDEQEPKTKIHDAKL